MNLRPRGFTLVESLIALLLLSMGLLGAWALLLSGLHTLADAEHRELATGLVRDMAARIRANPLARAAYSSSDATTSPPDCDAPLPCDITQRAAADLAHFSAAARFSLPGADTATEVDFAPAIGAAATDRYAITVRWRGTRERTSITLQLLVAPVAG